MEEIGAQKIQSWIDSEKYLDLIMEFEERYETLNPAYLDIAVYLFATKKISLAEFIQKISEQASGQEETNQLIEEIKNIILAPIIEPLKESGVELGGLNIQTPDEILTPTIEPLKEVGAGLNASNAQIASQPLTPLLNTDENKEEITNIQPKDFGVFQALRPDFSNQQTIEKQQTKKIPEENEQKPPEPPAPKIIHYSDLRTPLDEPLQKNAQTAITQEQPPNADEPKIRLDASDTQPSSQTPTPPPSIPNKISPKNIIDLKDIPL